MYSSPECRSGKVLFSKIELITKSTFEETLREGNHNVHRNLNFKGVTVVQQVSGSQHTLLRIWPRSWGVFTCTVLQNRMGYGL